MDASLSPLQRGTGLMPTLAALLTSATLSAASATMPAAPLPADALPALTVRAPRTGLRAATATAARAELPSLPGAASVLSADAWAHGRTATLRDYLMTAPGLIVQPRQGSEESRLSLRGSGVQRTFHLRGIALFQDGQPLNQADGGGDFQALDPALIDHVVVRRGASAGDLGLATLGGAIDHRSPTGQTRPGLHLRSEAGSFAAFKLAVSSGYRAAEDDGVGSDAFVGISAAQQEGYRRHSRQENLRVHANLGSLFRGDAVDVDNRIFVAASQSRSQLSGALTRAQVDDDPRQANPGSALRDSRRDYPLLRLSDHLRFQSGTAQLDLSAGYARKEIYHPLAFALITQDSDDTFARVILRSDAPWLQRGNQVLLSTTIVHGRTLARQYGYAAPSGNARVAVQADAVQIASGVESSARIQHELGHDVWSIAGLHAVLARREQADEFLANGDQSGARTWTGLNPHLGLRWRTSDHDSDHDVFALVSRSFEPPSFAEYIARDASGQTRPQQNLKAQSAWTYELGARGRMPRLAYEAVAYAAAVRHEYLSYQVAPGLAQTINAERTVHRGLELGLIATVLRDALADDDRIVLEQTALLAQYRFRGDASYGDAQLPGLPERTWRGALRWQHGGFSLGPDAEWQSRWPVDFAGTLHAPASFLIGASAAYRARSWSCFASARNLADRAFIATSGIAAPTSPAIGQALFQPGDGRAFTCGFEARY